MTEPRPFPTPREVFVDTITDLLDTPPQMLTDLQFAETEARRVAEDQVLVELFANARDAAFAHRGDGPPRVRVEADGDALLVANDGAHWSRQGYRAVRRIGGSPKRELPKAGAPGQRAIPLSLGRHGIGFRSVLAVTSTPEIHGVDETGRRFALGFGAPRIVALARAASAGDVPGCLAALRHDEQRWWEELLDERALPERSLVRHARRWQVGPEDLERGLPRLAFPLALADDEVAPRVVELLQGVGEERPYTTLIRLPLPPDKPHLVEGLLGQIDQARRCFLGTRIRCLIG